MKIFKAFTSVAIPLAMDNVDTDMIIPAQFLTKVNREGYGEHLFERLKEQNPQFVFNDQRYAGAKIVVTQSNFGCGSSREHAVWALMQAGIDVVIAESYSDIFFSNAAKNGLVAISLPQFLIAKLLKQAQQTALTLTIDLNKQIITTSSNEEINFDFDPFHKDCFLKGLDELDYLLEATK